MRRQRRSALYSQGLTEQAYAVSARSGANRFRKNNTDIKTGC